MLSWKLNAYKVFAFCLLSLSIPSFALSQETQETRASTGITSEIQVVLIGIRSFVESQDIKNAITKSEGVTQVSMDSVTPGLLTLHVSYSGDLKILVDQWKVLFADKYQLVEKKLPNGQLEIDLSPRI